MKNEDVKKLVEYWQKTAERDYQTMSGLFKLRRYPESLFYGHIVLEKVFKALVVQNKKKEAPKIHDLVKLSELAGLKTAKDQKEYLKIVSRFNMRTRYPDIKFSFYKSSNLKYTKENLDKIKKIYKDLCQKFK